MATIDPTYSDEHLPNTDITWETLTENDTASAAKWQGGEGFVSVYGTFGSATVNIQVSLDDGTIFFVPDTGAPPDGVAFTADGLVKFDLPPCQIKPVASGGTSQDVDIKILPKRKV